MIQIDGVKTVKTLGFENTVIKTDFQNKDLGKIYNILSTNLYSNPINAIVRELCSNIKDSYVGTNKNPEVIIEYKDNYISFIDNGIGMSEEFMCNDFFRFGNSSKENSNDFIGLLGLGSKTPFAYTDKYNKPYFITTIKDGVKLEFIYFKDEYNIPTPKLLNKTILNDKSCSGTTISFEIENNSDLLKFKRAIEAELIYFENLNLKGFDNTLLENNIIYKGNNFIYSTKNKNSNLNICYGNIVYNLKPNVISNNNHYAYFDLYVPIGLLEFTPNREELIYNENTIKVIQETYEKAKEEFQKKFPTKTFDNFSDYIEHKQTENYILDLDYNNRIVLNYNWVTLNSNYKNIELNLTKILTNTIVKRIKTLDSSLRFITKHNTCFILEDIKINRNKLKDNNIDYCIDLSEISCNINEVLKDKNIDKSFVEGILKDLSNYFIDYTTLKSKKLNKPYYKKDKELIQFKEFNRNIKGDFTSFQFKNLKELNNKIIVYSTDKNQITDFAYDIGYNEKIVLWYVNSKNETLLKPITNCFNILEFKQSDYFLNSVLRQQIKDEFRRDDSWFLPKDKLLKKTLEKTTNNFKNFIHYSKYKYLNFTKKQDKYLKILSEIEHLNKKENIIRLRDCFPNFFTEYIKLKTKK